MGIRILIPKPRLRTAGAPRRRFLWVAIAVAVSGVAYTFFGARGWVGTYRARTDVARLEAQVTAARESNEALAEQLGRLRNDPEAVEREARERLGLVKPGEKVYLLPRIPAPDATVDPEPNADSPDRTASQ